MAAEVYQVPRGPDGQSYYNQPSSNTPPLRRSPPSSSSLFLGTSPPSLSSSPKRAACSPPPIQTSTGKPHAPPSVVSNSSWDSSPHPSTVDFSNLSSWNSTPASSALSFDTQLPDEGNGDLNFPLYDSVNFEHRGNDHTPPDSDAPEPSTTTDTTQSNSPLPTPTVADDTAVKQEPSRHVDYLSHDWREEDIWASWRHIVSQRRVYGQRSRLENASWRTWAKSKYRLSTVPPEKLNWLKESDVTWLYGPLTPASSHPITNTNDSQPTSGISRNSSFINKKPILKKRSMSEVMLQRSISTSSLVKQAAASVQAQQSSSHTGTHHPFAHAPSVGASSEPPSRDEFDYFSTRENSIASNTTPGEGLPEKHIRFDEKVEQCIAVECKEGDISDDDDEIGNDPSTVLSESSSDEGLVMMKQPNIRRSDTRRKSERKNDAERAHPAQTRMIEEIEATTLKSRTDRPEVTQEAQHHVFGTGVSWGSRKILSPSPSQETLRPPRPSRNFLLATEDDEDEDDDDNSSSSSWSFGASNPKSSLGAATSPTDTSRSSPFAGSTGYSDGYDGIEGMRRTESGMFMPYDEDDEDAIVATGLFGRVSETFNTMRDIGHVLYTAFRT